jgi:NADPH2 dehydrogenase
MNGPGAAGVPAPWEGPYRTSWGTDIDRPLLPDLAEPIGLVGDLAADGVGLFNITLGNPYANPHFGRPFEYSPSDGYQSPEHPLIGVARHFDLTARVQAAHPGLPLIGSGYSWLQAFAFAAGAANIRDGRATFMGIGRAALSHPDFGRYVMEGRPLDPKRTCRTFSYCTGLMRSKHNDLGQYPAGCPPFDKAVYGPIWDEAQESAPKPKG